MRPSASGLGISFNERSSNPVGGVRSGGGNPSFMSSAEGGSGQAQDRDWMSFNSASTGGRPAGGMERPQTAASSNRRVLELENELKNERKQQKRYVEEIESLKREIHKSNFSSFTQNSSEVSVTDGRLPMVPGVREIALDDLTLGEQIGQGGFSVIHKGSLGGTQVAIKKIFDPKITDELLAEIQNEIVMTAILRHPNIALLMGVAPRIPNIVIVSEFVDGGSLFTLLHMKKHQVPLDLQVRLRIALDCARAFQYMHKLGIVHRDIKSHNVLVSQNFNVKVCDFGLAKFKVSAQNPKTPTRPTPLSLCLSNLVLLWCRPTWARERCSMRARRTTWRQSCFRSGSTTRAWTCLRLERCCGNWCAGRYPTMGSRQWTSAPPSRRARPSSWPIMPTSG